MNDRARALRAVIDAAFVDLHELAAQSVNTTAFARLARVRISFERSDEPAGNFFDEPCVSQAAAYELRCLMAFNASTARLCERCENPSEVVGALIVAVGVSIHDLRDVIDMFRGTSRVDDHVASWI